MDDLAPLPIVYQDDTLIAINKPAGLLVHRSPIDKRETRFAVQQLRDQIGRHVFPVHRLDRPTSGILLFTYDGISASILGRQMMARQIVKQYTAIVRGFVQAPGMVDYALKFKADKFADKDRGDIAPQPACTVYQPESYFELPVQSDRYPTSRYTLVRLYPHTGRKHQLRRHMVHLRHPILGDTSHGDGKQNKFLRERFDFKNLALSCTRLGFEHPASQRWLEITCSPGASIEQLLNDWQVYQVKHKA